MNKAKANNTTASVICPSVVRRRSAPYAAKPNTRRSGPATRIAATGRANDRASSPSNAGSLRAMLISQASRAPKETMEPHKSVKPSMSRPSVGDEVGEHRLFHAVAGSPRLSTAWARPRWVRRGPAPRCFSPRRRGPTSPRRCSLRARAGALFFPTPRERGGRHRAEPAIVHARPAGRNSGKPGSDSRPVQRNGGAALGRALGECERGFHAAIFRARH